MLNKTPSMVSYRTGGILWGIVGLLNFARVFFIYNKTKEIDYIYLFLGILFLGICIYRLSKKSAK